MYWIQYICVNIYIYLYVQKYMCNMDSNAQKGRIENRLYRSSVSVSHELN